MNRITVRGVVWCGIMWTRMSEKKIHFMGVGGVGMAGLAVLLKAEGHVVTGCDNTPPEFAT